MGDPLEPRRRGYVLGARYSARGEVLPRAGVHVGEQRGGSQQRCAHGMLGTLCVVPTCAHWDGGISPFVGSERIRRRARRNRQGRR
jgi:hypothetical protein